VDSTLPDQLSGCGSRQAGFMHSPVSIIHWLLGLVIYLGHPYPRKGSHIHSFHILIAISGISRWEKKTEKTFERE
jgi:hypothetical protein